MRGNAQGEMVEYLLLHQRGVGVGLCKRLLLGGVLELLRRDNGRLVRPFG